MLNDPINKCLIMNILLLYKPFHCDDFSFMNWFLDIIRMPKSVSMSRVAFNSLLPANVDTLSQISCEISKYFETFCFVHTHCSAQLFGSTDELYTRKGYTSTKAQSGYCPYPYPYSTVEHCHIS